jgi:quinol-cytochrome oxidoreductase complex cytochrome b subunit
LRWFHRATSFLILPAMLAFVIAAIGLLVQRRRRIAIALPVIAVLGVVGAGITGCLLPWDQLSLNSVTVGENIRGYIDILGNNDVNYVLVGNSEVSLSTFTRVYWLHAAVLPVIIVGLLLATSFATRGSAGRSEQPVVGEVGAGPQGAELLPNE